MDAQQFQRGPYNAAGGQQPGRVPNMRTYQTNNYAGIASASDSRELHDGPGGKGYPEPFVSAATGGSGSDSDGDASGTDGMLSSRKSPARKRCCTRRRWCQVCGVASALIAVACCAYYLFDNSQATGTETADASPSDDAASDSKVCWPVGQQPPPVAALALAQAGQAVETSPSPAPSLLRRLQLQGSVGPESMQGPLEAHASAMPTQGNISPPGASFHFSMGNVKESVSTGTNMPADNPQNLAPAWQQGMQEMAGVFVKGSTSLPPYIQAQLSQAAASPVPGATVQPSSTIPPSSMQTTTLTTCIVLPEQAQGDQSPSGHCAGNDQDNEHWLQGGGAENFEGTNRDCANTCSGNGECVSACVQSKEHYSEACAQCFGELVSCTSANCLLDCSMEQPGDCERCVHEKCNPAFWSCSGLDRQALVNALESPGRRLRTQEAMWQTIGAQTMLAQRQHQQQSSLHKFTGNRLSR